MGVARNWTLRSGILARGIDQREAAFRVHRFAQMRGASVTIPSRAGRSVVFFRCAVIAVPYRRSDTARRRMIGLPFVQCMSSNLN